MVQKRKVNGEKPPHRWWTKFVIKRLAKTLSAIFVNTTFVCLLVVLPNLHHVLGR